MKILLGVSGSISAYRALDICRNLTKEGHQVKVVLTQGSLEFLNPNTFSYLGAEVVYLPIDDFNPSKNSSGNVLHIDLVKWCDRLVIAPASANTIAKLAHGHCNDLLSSVFLALGTKTCLIFPAMNTNMLHHPMTIKNLASLSALPNIFIHPTESGELACGDTGEGKLPSVELISEVVPIINLKNNQRKVLITTGATIAPLDPVRYMTNPASGLTGHEIAKAYLAQGHQVTLVHGHAPHPKIHHLKHLPNIQVIAASTAKEMLKVIENEFDKNDIYISTAAISDVEFEFQSQKVKKNDLNDGLKISASPDILKLMLERRTHQKIIGFAAETDCSEKVLQEKWTRKPVDLLIGNQVNNGTTQQMQGFQTSSNTYYFVKSNQIVERCDLSKKELAKKILEQFS
jgi:phosphopantothenoylcysteine decarboxylase / phosphopantothenate---cysteine ligase